VRRFGLASLPELLACVFTIFACMPASAEKPLEIVFADMLIGKIELPVTKIDLLSTGDNVLLDIDPDAVIPGDRLAIYEPVESHKENLYEEDEAGRPYRLSGTLVVTRIDKSRVYGQITGVKREILPDGRLMFELSPEIQNSRYFGFLKKVAMAKLKDPANEFIKTGLIDATDGNGNVTAFSQSVFRDLKKSVCARRQFKCVDSDRIRTFLARYGITTSASIGPFIRKKLFEKFEMDQLFTSEVAVNGDEAAIYLTSWDLKNELKTPEAVIKASVEDFTATGDNPEQILTPFRKIEYGHLKITVNRSVYIKGRRVEHLYMEKLDEHIFTQYKKDLSANLSDDVAFGNVTVSIGNRLFTEQDGAVIFDDIIRAKTHRVMLSVTPILKGESSLPLGAPIEEEIELTIPPDESIHMEIILKIYENRAIIIMDSNPAG